MERSRDLQSDVLPPSRGVDTSHLRTNKPVKLRRSAADRRRQQHRSTTKNGERWNGDAFKPSPQRERELADLRLYEALADCDDLPDFERCIGASSLLGMANAGAIAAWSPQMRRAVDLRRAIALDFDEPCGEPHRFDCTCCSRKDKAFRARCASMIFWLVRIHVAPIAEREHEWLIARHVDVGKLLCCCPRIAFAVMKHLHQHGWVRRAPQYDAEHVTLPCGKEYRRHVRGPSAYAIADRALEVLGIVSLPSLPKCEASEPQGVSFTSPKSGGLERERAAGSSTYGAPAAPDTTTPPAPAPAVAPLQRSTVPDAATGAPTALSGVKPRRDALRRPEEKSKVRTRSEAHAVRALAALRRREADTAATIQRSERRAARAELDAERSSSRAVVAAKLNALVQAETVLHQTVSRERAEIRIAAGAVAPSSSGPARTPNGATLCSVCGLPAHASETDDHDRCADCREPSPVDEPDPSRAAAATPEFQLTEAELAQMRATTPRPRRPEAEPLVDAIMKPWITKYGKVPVVVEEMLARLRRDDDENGGGK